MLLHVCCAHCAAYPVQYWPQQGYEVTAFFYNPNIHPFNEYCHRRDAVKKLAEAKKFPLNVPDTYDFTEYFRDIASDTANRCRYCFKLRLSKTAAYAKQNGFNGFSTTLLISRHQDHELIKKTGDGIAAETGVPFLYADLRKRFSDSRVISKPLHLYVQQYCGCVYSKWEAFLKNLKNQTQDSNLRNS